MRKIFSFFLAIIMFLIPSANVPKAEINRTGWNTDYTYVFVHGLSGWGSYDFVNRIVPYWGLLSGNMNKYLNARGLSTYSASVDPYGSTWDRTCELYAQLTGTVVDYGAAHSEKYGHDRYGEDYTCKPLIPAWSAEDKINLFGHSFGGTTIRYLAELMANGSAPEDSAIYDMYIDNAFAFNERISTLPGVYYFSYATSAAVRNEDGTYSADKSVTEITNRDGVDNLGSRTFTTDAGYVVDESWLDSDGTVNTVSAMAPSGAPRTDFDENGIRPGVWNVMPVWRGDHQALIGGIFIHGEIRQLYVEIINRINSL